MPALLTPARDGWFGEGSLAHDPDARQSAPRGAPLDARRTVVDRIGQLGGQFATCHEAEAEDAIG